MRSGVSWEIYDTTNINSFNFDNDIERKPKIFKMFSMGL